MKKQTETLTPINKIKYDSAKACWMFKGYQGYL